MEDLALPHATSFEQPFVSVGAAIATPGQALDQAMLMRRADHALYSAEIASRRAEVRQTNAPRQAIDIGMWYPCHRPEAYNAWLLALA
ncbi:MULTISPECIES: hypothetical protein [Halomonadaceae]|uniref:hypothetical protein n=1 Tax=Halomonadaceae TaxID=28256 RepID=UPI001597FFA9|nr:MULTISPECIES: hypothetical protein [Halomonas]QJQ94237.1 hypothetical protein HIO72_02350 [Halomonas sp. PA5]